ncbi:hypothetical protein ONR02_25040, partial [Salmonella enterica subsp. enterica serovar Lubbock]|nr:hypothetical protein [Salmonella enterica subsp. enterica serovar Lubbock]
MNNGKSHRHMPMWQILYRRLMQRDKTPLAILLMAAVVGTLTGLVGVAFEKAVSWVQNMR